MSTLEGMSVECILPAPEKNSVTFICNFISQKQDPSIRSCERNVQGTLALALFGTKGVMAFVLFFRGISLNGACRCVLQDLIVTLLQEIFRKLVGMLPSRIFLPLIAHTVAIYLSPRQF
jgi:hypothetical protein